MRLLNKDTLLLERFPDDEAPPFVILSHRWGPDECTLQSFARESTLSKDQWSTGTAKIIAFCGYVKDKPEQYVWADTCCIDKTSSAEAQAAINSMYRWYQQAAFCLVFLEDVTAFDVDTPPGREEFMQSRWWTRGWTLQELVAPLKEAFVNRDWKHIGSRDDLSSLIETLTGIPATHLGNEALVHATPVGQRMSWMANRRTTVVEDIAYCLLGIFDVNMTMLYGEGDRAFIRLQTEILQGIDDESIFLWTTSEPEKLRRSSILAPSPAHFVGLEKFPYRLDTYFLREPCRLTARGLHIEFYAARVSVLEDIIHIPLNCLRDSDGNRPYITVQRYTDNAYGLEKWKRIDHDEIKAFSSEQYAVPDMEQQAFLKQKREMEMAAHLARNGHNQKGAFSHHHAVFEFTTEGIRRKIFVR